MDTTRLLILVPVAGLVLAGMVIPASAHTLAGRYGECGCNHPNQICDGGGLAIDSADNIFVVDWLSVYEWNGTGYTTWPPRILKYSGSGQYLQNFSNPFNPAGSFLMGAASDSQDRLYVLDSYDTIHRFEPSGAYSGNLTFTTGLDPGNVVMIMNMACNSRDELLLSDTGTWVSHGTVGRIQAFERNGTFLWSSGTNGTGAGQFWGNDGISVDPWGNILVVDSGNHRIVRLDGNGTYLTSWGTNGTGGSQLLAPRDIATDGAGRVYVTDWSGYWPESYVGAPIPDHIHVFSSTGTYIETIGGATTTPFLGQIAVNSSGYLFALQDQRSVSPGSGGVLVFRPDFDKAAPKVTSVTPAAGRRGKSIAITGLNGTGFLPDAVTSLVKGAARIRGKAVTVVNDTWITCSFRIPLTAETGTWDVKVTNPNGKSGVKKKAFRVKA